MSDFAIGSKTWPGLSKLIEETGEVQQVAGKLLGTGGAVDHWDGSNLRQRIEEELGDLQAAMLFFATVNGLDQDRIWARAEEKIHLFERWHTAGDGA